MKKYKTLSFIIFILTVSSAFAQGLTQESLQSLQGENQQLQNRHFIGSSLWVLYDKISSEPAGFYQLSYGYQLTAKDNIIVEAITWRYNEPLGTYENSKKKYPGKVRSYGIGLGYQHFLWKNLFTSVIATPFLQQFYNKDGKKTQKGFQLYMQFIAGYRFEFFNKRLFVEPAAAFKYWPISTNFPKDFAKIEKGKPNYILEPSLTFGFRF